MRARFEGKVLIEDGTDSGGRTVANSPGLDNSQIAHGLGANQGGVARQIG